MRLARGVEPGGSLSGDGGGRLKRVEIVQLGLGYVGRAVAQIIIEERKRWRAERDPIGARREPQRRWRRSLETRRDRAARLGLRWPGCRPDHHRGAEALA